VAVSFIGGGNRYPEKTADLSAQVTDKLYDLEKTTDLSQVTDKLDHIMLCTSP